MIDIPERTGVLFADIGCPWAHVAVQRWHVTRAQMGLADVVTLDVRAFPLEIFNQRPTPKRILEAEIPVAGSLAPEAGWSTWQRQTYDWAVTTLPALEAAYAAKAQSARVGELVDRALRKAFFGQSRNISMRHEILDVVGSCEGVDLNRLERDLDSGTHRRALFDDFQVARSSAVKGSPHFFLPDGSDWHNPGVDMHWEGDAGVGFPVVDWDDASIYEEMLIRAQK